MKNVIIFFLILILPFPLGAGEKAKTNNKQIHPSFLHLLKTNPRNKKILYPSIPRVSAKQAYHLFVNKKAVLFGVGFGMNKNYTILGTIKIPDHRRMNPNLLKKLKKIKNKYILVFCS